MSKILIGIIILIVIAIIANIMDYVKDNPERKKTLFTIIIIILLIIIAILLYDKNIFYKLTTRIEKNNMNEILLTEKLTDKEKAKIALYIYNNKNTVYGKTLYYILNDK